MVAQQQQFANKKPTVEKELAALIQQQQYKKQKAGKSYKKFVW